MMVWGAYDDSFEKSQFFPIIASGNHFSITYTVEELDVRVPLSGQILPPLTA